MANDQLKKYVSEQLARGASRSDLERIILESGWSADEVAGVFKELDSTAPVTKKINLEQSGDYKKSFASKSAVIIVSMVVLIIIGALVWHFDVGPFGKTKQHPLVGFTRLIIDPAYAADNFTLTPEESDTMGVSSTSGYILKSKIKVPTDLIQNNLKVEPAVDYQLTTLSSQEWLVKYNQPLLPNTLVKISLATSYLVDTGSEKTRDYGWVFQVKDHFKVLSSIPRQAATHVPTNTGIEITFSHENIANPEQYFFIEPIVAGRFEQHRRTLVFIPNNPLQKATIYHVTVKKGLAPVGGEEGLEQDYSFSFETESFNNFDINKPWFKPEDLIDSSSREEPVFEVYSNNIITPVKVEVYKLGDWQEFYKLLKRRDEIPWWSYSKDQFRQDTSQLKSVGTFEVTIMNEEFWQYVKLPVVLPVGYYILDFSVAGLTEQSWLQVTDLSAYLSIAQDKTTVWVNDLISRQPAGRAQVEFLEENKQYQTGSNGLLVFATPLDLVNGINNTDQTKRYYLKAQTADKIVLVPATNLMGINRRSNYSNSNFVADSYWSYLYTDRPRYQTTDVIKFWGLVKERSTKSAPREEIKITLYKEGYVDYYYQPIRIMEQKVELTSLATFQGEFKYYNLQPDYYTLELKVGNYIIETKYINIQPYVKPAYEIKLVPERTVAYAGDNIKLVASASFFDGTPVPNLKLNYRFPSGETEVITDERGTVELNYSAPYSPCVDVYCWPNNAWVEVNPTEEELAEITAGVNLRFYGPKVYAATAVNYPSKGVAQVKVKTRFINLATLDNYWGGEEALGKGIAPGTKLEGELVQTKYQSQITGTAYDFINKRTYNTYTYTESTKTVDTFSTTTDRSGLYFYQYKPEPGSSYRLRLKVFDADNRFDVIDTYIYYYDGRIINYPTSSDRPYYHLVVPGAEQYSVGEEVKILFMNNNELLPSSDFENYLFLQYQNGLQEYFASGSPEYRFNFEERDIPNINLIGIYFNGISYVETEPVSLAFDKKDRLLNITVTSNKRIYKSGENVTLALRVTNSSGQPQTAEVNLNLVDEAYYAVAGYNPSPLESIYKSMSLGLIYSNFSHRPLFKEVYGGAEKGGGGGGVRSVFTDVALFQAVRIDSNGMGTVTFKLPDNITSWRITAQGVSQNLFVGVSITKLPVSLPVFADIALGEEYLLADKPVARARAYGTALTKNDKVGFSILAPSLGIDSEEKLETVAFTPAYFNLPPLSLGRHDITYQLSSGVGNDAVKLPLTVIASRLLTREVVSNEQLSTTTRVQKFGDQPLEVVLSDIGQNQLYQPLLNLSYSWGDRVDQVVARKKATVLLNNIYGFQSPVPTFESYRYQLADGGLTLLPYGSADEELSARLASVAKEEFDSLSLKQYFFAKLEDKQSTSQEITLALYGLAALNEPILPRLSLWSQRQDLSPKERLYIAMAWEELGCTEQARQSLLGLINDYAVRRGPEIALKINDSGEEITALTALAASLASALDLSERDGLWTYVITHPNKEVLLNLEELNYITKTLPRLKSSPAEVVYRLSGREEKVVITGNQAFRLLIQPQQVNELSFVSVTGDVRVAISLERPKRIEELGYSNDISIRREYWLNGQQTNKFKQGDVIEVRLYPSFSADALPGEYELIDLLPSGLLPVTKLSSGEQYDCHYWYPYNIEGQRVRYQLAKSWLSSYCGGSYLKYYARVKTKGTYLAEPALLQSFRSPDIINHSTEQTIIID